MRASRGAAQSRRSASAVAAIAHADAVADLVARVAAQRLEPVRHLAREALGLELVVERRVERDEQVALLGDLVTGARPRGELELVGLEDDAADLDRPVVARAATLPTARRP